MPVPVLSEAQWRELLISYLQQKHKGKRTDPASYLGMQAEALAGVLAMLSKQAQDVDRDGIPAYQTTGGVLQSRCSSEALDGWAFTFGLPSNLGAGRFGRNGAQAASGGRATIYGTPGTPVPTGAALVDASGQVTVTLSAGVTVGVGGTATGVFQAATAGAAGNLSAGTILRWTSPPPGLTYSVTLSTGLSGGYDVEGDLDLLGRLIRHLQAGAKAGTAADIREWAESAQDSAGRSLGIARAYVLVGRSGLGSSDVVITLAGSGAGRDPGPTIQAEVQTWVNAQKAAGDVINVLRPFMPAYDKLKLKFRVVPAVGYGFDWSDAAAAGGPPTGLGVAVSSATTATITLPTATYGTVALAAAYAAGKSPRVQVSLPSYQAAPFQRKVVGTATGVGVITFTLDSSLPAAPSVGDKVYPGGGAVDAVALAALAKVDGCGPSTQSGYQDTLYDSWESVVSIGGLAQAALDAVDASGAKVLVYSPKVGNGVGVQIAVGVGGYTGDDFEPVDNMPGVAPQLAEVLAILVTP